MKKSLLSIFCICSSFLLYSQKIGINTNNPDTSAVLDIRSVDAGLLIPRMTSLQRTNIFNPAKGLLVFDNNTNSFWFYDGAFWSELLSEGNSLNQAYNKGGLGNGRKIIANDSAVIIEGTDGFYVDGVFGQGTDVELSGAGSKMFFNPRNASYRAGVVTGNHWDKDSIGRFSFAFGFNAMAMEDHSVAIGHNSKALVGGSMAFGSNVESSGPNSIAMGYNSKTNGSYSIALGYYSKALSNHGFAAGSNTTALGYGSTALGNFTKASGIYSSALGFATQSNGYGSTVIGIYNDTLVPSQSSVNNNTPLFIIGNGNHLSDRSNAFTVFKDGRVKINEEYTLPTDDGLNNQVIISDGAGTLSWANSGDIASSLDQAYDSGGPGEGRKIIATDSAVLIEGTDGFYVTGSPGLGTDVEISGAGTRMFFNPKKRAFRAGHVNGSHWDNDSIGINSISVGRDTKAKGSYSSSFGFSSNASGFASAAIGHLNNANGVASIALGQQSISNGTASIALGNASEANGSYSLATGNSTKANGNNSSALGAYTEANGSSSTSMGSHNISSGSNTTVMGNRNKANGYSSTVVGVFNDTLVSSEGINDLNNNTPLFIVGNGNFVHRSNALTVFKDGRVKINDVYTLPSNDGLNNQVITTNGSGVLTWINQTDLNTQNTLDEAYNEGGSGNGREVNASDSAVIINGTDGFYVTGSIGLGTDIEIDGAGARMFFNPKKGVFRSGYVSGNHWDADSVALYSVAIGYNTKAKGNSSIALGSNTEAIGSRSTSIGHNTIAKGAYSTSIGYYTKAFGVYSTSFGSNTLANGHYSLSFGNRTKAMGQISSTFGDRTIANGFASTVIGVYNDTIVSIENIVNNNTPLFIVGNGNSNITRSNALTVFKDGRVNINDEYILPINDGTNGQIISTDGSGVLSWANPKDSISSLNESYNKGGMGEGRKINAIDSAVVIEGTDGLYVTGTFNSGTEIEFNGAGTRMFFNPRKATFRSGRVTGNHWDNDSIGSYSVSFGYNTKATNTISTAFGNNTIASGYGSLATGFSTKARGNTSTAIGYSSEANANYSTAIGVLNKSDGLRSLSLGYSCQSNAENSFTFGKQNIASGVGSMSMGDQSLSSGVNSITLGYDLICSGTRSIALGRYNVQSPSYLFALGNGTSDLNRENSLHIFSTSNNAYFSGSVRPMLDNTVSLGLSSLRWTTVYATNGTINTSDSTLKENIVPLSYGLKDLMKLKPVNFSWKGDEYEKTKIGFLAQDLLEVIPEVVVTKEEVVDEETGEVTYQDAEKLGVYYSDLIPLLTKSIQEQQLQIQEQKVLLEQQQLLIEELLEKFK